jgi:futalosine hydrolase
VLLVVAATAFEAELVADADADADVVVAVCGIGPVEAALATVSALAEHRPHAVLQFGIAGAQTLAPGSLALGSEAVYCDVLDPAAGLPRVERVAADEDLLERARRTVPTAHVLPIGTTARVGGGTACEVEAMEGFGVLRAAALAGVPAIELRAVSNFVNDVDRGLWRIEEALAALRGALPPLV